MAHEHPVKDTSSLFIINEDRQISYGGEKKPVLTEKSHNSEEYTFSLNRTIDGHDMSLCNLVRIHYVNIGSPDKFYGVYDATSFMNVESDYIGVKWLVSRNATMYPGQLNFSIEFSCIGDDGIVEYTWNTAIFKDITVLPVLNNTDDVVESNVDVIANLISDYEEVKTIVESISHQQNQMLDAISSIEHAKPNKSDVANALSVTDNLNNSTRVMSDDIPVSYLPHDISFTMRSGNTLDLGSINDDRFNFESGILHYNAVTPSPLVSIDGTFDMPIKKGTTITCSISGISSDGDLYGVSFILIGPKDADGSDTYQSGPVLSMSKLESTMVLQEDAIGWRMYLEGSDTTSEASINNLCIFLGPIVPMYFDYVPKDERYLYIGNSCIRSDESGIVKCGSEEIYDSVIEIHTDTPSIVIQDITYNKDLRFELANIQSALDNIIEIQNGLIGGDTA